MTPNYGAEQANQVDQQVRESLRKPAGTDTPTALPESENSTRKR
jgi:hypothetical protein